MNETWSFGLVKTEGQALTLLIVYYYTIILQLRCVKKNGFWFRKTYTYINKVVAFLTIGVSENMLYYLEFKINCNLIWDKHHRMPHDILKLRCYVSL